MARLQCVTATSPGTFRLPGGCEYWTSGATASRSGRSRGPSTFSATGAFACVSLDGLATATGTSRSSGTLDADHQALLVGDAAYTLRSIQEQALPLLTVDDGDAMRSLSDIRAFARLVPEALIVPSHDPDAWRALRSVSRAS